MKRGAGNHILIGLLVVAVVLLALFFLGDRGFTGFAVFEQQTESNFSKGNYANVTYDMNASAIVLNESANATLGTYTSDLINAGSDAQWNNLTWEGEVPENTTLTFQVKTCSANCSDANFTDVSSVNNTFDFTNLSGQYFQYQASFSTSNLNMSPSLSKVVIDYTASVITNETVSLNISEPTGEKSSQSGISISFTTVGNNLTCWYNIDNGINTTLPGCGSSNFDVPDDGNYVFNLYANNSLGTSDYQSSSFKVDTPPPSSSSEETSEESGITTGQITTEVTEIVKLIAGEIQDLTMNPGKTEEVTWSVESVLTFPLQACLFESVGEVSSWISHTETLDLNAGEEHSFVFDVVVPEGTVAGSYSLGVSLDCPAADAFDFFTVDVVEKKLEFGLISVERTEQDEVEVTYSLEELSGEDQNVEIGLSLLNDINEKVAEVSTSQVLAANAVEEFLAVVPVDETLEGELTLVADLNSEIYSASVQERVVISGTPTAGFAIFGGEGGAGGLIIFLIVVVVLVAIFFIVRYMRKADVSLKDVLRFRFGQ